MTDLRDQLQRTLGAAYTLERELGGGGMSRVYLAHETALGRQVVVKVIAPELAEGLSAERFAREVKLAARLQQANIVPVLSAGEAGGLPYYTMPFVRGESLRLRLTSGARPTIGESVSILRDVARALAYAHAEGIVHRDIKPENILLSHGTAVVTDFGIAKALSAARTQEGSAGLHAGENAGAILTLTGSSIGTPAYMAPEQAAGDTVDHRADLYAWGVMAYELLSGVHPFAGKSSAQQLIAAHLAETPVALGARSPAVSPALSQLVMRCLAKAPADRPSSAAELLRDLDGAFTPDGLRSTGTHPAAAHSKLRRTVIAAAVLAVLAIVVVLATWGRAGSWSTSGAAADRSVAVLPLANLSGDKADDYFGIGLAEELTRALSKTGVRVIGRVSAGALQARGLDERAIAKELGVGSLLTGTVQRADGQIRIQMSLLNAGDGAVRWTEKYDRPLANVFAVQDEIARNVSVMLLGSLGGSPATAVRTETTDPEAHALFLQGMVLFNRRGARSLKQAITLFEQASARDPKYARAQASLAMALAVLPAYVMDSTPEIVARAVAAANRAIAMDSTIPESYAALGYGYSLLGAIPQAEASFQRALALDSTVATSWGWYGLLAGRLGQYREAGERVARAGALEPASLIARVWEAQILQPQRRFAEADSMASVAMGMDSTFMLAWTWKANALLGLKKTTEAISLLEWQLRLLPPGRPEEAHGLLAYAYAVAGRAKEARATMDSIRARVGGKLPATGALAAALEELGDHEQAVALLGQAVTRHDTWLVQFPQLERYDKLRKDPRVAAMLDRLGRAS
ncbi:MAG: protein kinase [Gemmatimonadota bacterium]|nr:protein kinase [Gemmatimonadota bacterium]